MTSMDYIFLMIRMIFLVTHLVKVIQIKLPFSFHLQEELALIRHGAVCFPNLRDCLAIWANHSNITTFTLVVLVPFKFGSFETPSTVYANELGLVWVDTIDTTPVRVISLMVPDRLWPEFISFMSHDVFE